MLKHKKKRVFTHLDRQRFERAGDHYLHDCYRRTRPVRAKEFAKTLDMTPEYASWLAVQILGGTLREWLRGKQIEHAIRLLRRTPLSTEEIAVLSGFGTNSTFRRAFVKSKGMTPAVFRELKK